MSPKYLVKTFPKTIRYEKNNTLTAFFFPKNIHVGIVLHADLPQLTALASHPQHPTSHLKLSKLNFHYLLHIQVFLDLNIVTAVLVNLLCGDSGGQAMAEHLHHHNSLTP